MLERNLEISFDEHKCRIGNQKGILKTINIIETLPNGKKKTVHTEVNFKSQESNQGYQALIKLLKKPIQSTGRRAA